MSTGDVTSLATKVYFYVENKMAVDLSMSNCMPSIVCPCFPVNGNIFLPAVWKFEAKLMSTPTVSVFDGIDHAVATFEINLIQPGEGGFF